MALALLVAQFGAAAHAYSHLSRDRPTDPGSTQTCGICLSFAPVTVAVGGAPSVVLTVPHSTGHAVSTDAVAIHGSSPHPAFQPRAPPSLL